MSSLSRFSAAKAFTAVALLTVSSAFAQTPRAPGVQQFRPTPVDSQLAACLIADNENEVALAKLALSRTQNGDVKEFAQMMITDHGKMLTRLETFAGKRVIPALDPANLNTPRAEQPEQPRRPAENPGDPTTRPPEGGDPARVNPRTVAFVQAAGGDTIAPKQTGLDLVSLKRELALQCLQSAQQELGRKSGREFDQCFVGMQIAGHMHMSDALQVFRRHASPQLQQVLDEALQTTQVHLKHAKELITDLSKDTDQTTTETSGR